MNHNKQYTFEDWVNGNLKKVFQENFFRYDKSEQNSFIDYLLEQGLLNEEEHEKIVSARKYATNLVLEYHKKKTANNLSENISNATNEQNYLEFRKQSIELRLDEIGRDEVEDMLSGKQGMWWITPEAYNDILENDRKNYPQELPAYFSNKDGRLVINPTTEAYLLYIELSLIEEKLSELNTTLGGGNNKILIDQFVETFSKRTKYSANAIRTYLTDWEKHKGHNQRRSKTKETALPKCLELENASDGTLSNWEENWMYFCESRTGN